MYQDTLNWLKSKKPLLEDLKKTYERHNHDDQKMKNNGKSEFKPANINSKMNENKRSTPKREKYETALSMRKKNK
jgi:hypothetical protein